MPKNRESELQNEARARLQIILPHIAQDIPLAKISRNAGVPLRTLWRWVHRYRELGWMGLVRKQRSDAAGRKECPSELQRLIEGLLLSRPNLTMAAVHRQAASICADHNWPLPSYGIVRDIAKSLDPGLVMLAHQGSKAYRQSFDLLYRREAERPNQIWQADHCQLDCHLLDAQGNCKKPWLTIILDDYSRAVAGFQLTFESPSALQTSLALRQAIWRKADPGWHVFGLPDTFYTDHGSDFTSLHIERVAAELQFELVFSTVGQPRGRGKIERFFNTVNQLFLCHVPGYAPPNAGPSKPQLTLNELDCRFRRWLVSEYLLRDHSEIKTAPQSRWEVGGFVPRYPELREQLDLLLLTVAQSRKVHRDGIHFEGLRYMDMALADFVGQSVIVRYDPSDLAEIAVFQGDRFLCRAVCSAIADQTITLRGIIKARNQRRRSLRNVINDRYQLVQSFFEAQTSTPPSEIEQVVTPEQLQQPRFKRYVNE